MSSSRAFLTRTVEIFRSNDDVGLVHCAVRHIDETGAPLPMELQQLFDSDAVDRDDAALRRLLLEGCVINPAGVLVRREAYESVGPFTDRIIWGVDWHMWSRIAMTWRVGYVDETLARYRHHTTSGTSGTLTSARNGRDELWALNDLFRIAEERRPDLLTLRREAREGVANRTWWLAERMCQEGEMRAARKGLRNAIRFRPALLAKARTWALLGATFVGYDWFTRAQHRKRGSVYE